LKSKEKINLYLELAKVRITFFVAFSTSVGFLLAADSISFKLFFSSLFVFILASGASVLNHIQEKNTDALMDRTKNRPLPSGKVKFKNAILFCVLLISIGLIGIFLTSNFTAFVLGILAVVWYNLIYTPLKKITALAVVPGAIIGAIPPAIGWVSAGGNIFDFEIYAIGMFFFIWQIPHFWLLQIIYNNDYERAGFPTLKRIFSDIQISRLTFVWIVALAASCFAIPLFGIVTNKIVNIILFAAGIWLIIKSSIIIKKYSDRLAYKYAFKEVNVYVLIIVLVLSINKLIQIV